MTNQTEAYNELRSKAYQKEKELQDFKRNQKRVGNKNLKNWENQEDENE